MTSCNKSQPASMHFLHTKPSVLVRVDARYRVPAVTFYVCRDEKNSVIKLSESFLKSFISTPGHFPFSLTNTFLKIVCWLFYSCLLLLFIKVFFCVKCFYLCMETLHFVRPQAFFTLSGTISSWT